MPLYAPARRTVPGLLALRARTHGAKTFLTFLDAEFRARSWTYAEVQARVDALARSLLDAGLRPGERAVVHLGNSPEFVFAFLALQRIGAVCVATNLKSAPDEMRYYVDHSESVAILTEGEHLPLLEEILPDLPRVRFRWVGRGAKVPAGWRSLDAAIASGGVLGDVPHPDNAETAAILYTSGTTSRPKGVEIAHANYVWAGELMARNTALTERDTHAIACPFFHINAQTYSLIPAIAAGADVVLMERFSKSRYWGAVREHRATVASLVTSMIRMFLAEPERDGERDHALRLVGCAAATPAFEERFGVRTLGWFGMTETISTPIVTSLYDPGRARAVGFPSPGYAVKLLNEAGRECEADELGECWVQGVPGVSLMKGYLKDPEATAATIRDGWLRTGDNLRRDSDGYLYYVNRAKDMIKRGGENVAAGEVERVLMSHPGVYEAAVIAVPDPILDEAIKAFVIPRPGAAPTAEDVIAHCRARLASFKVPSEVEFREELPRSTLDKVAKKVLVAEERARRGKA